MVSSLNFFARFSSVVSTEVNRKIFIQSVTRLLRTYDFDGLNLDWRFPGKAGSQSDNKQKFTVLCQVRSFPLLL